MSSLVPRSRRSWIEVGVAGVALVVGVAAESDSYDWADARHWLPDLLTGWILIAGGLAARRRTGLLLAATGFIWFAGNFAPSMLVLHRGPLVQLVLTYPDGAAGVLPAVAFAYAVAAAGATWWSSAATITLAAALVAAAALRYTRSVGRLRREARYAMRAAALLGAILGVVATVNVTTDTASARDGALLGYQLTLCGLAVYLAYGAVRRPWGRPAVTDLVVDLGEERTRTVREALARALGDPTLEVAYRVGDGYIDAAGRPVGLPADSGRRHVTRIEREGEEVAVLVHDPAVLDDPGLVDAVAAATRLAAANVRLQAEVRTQVSELEASRRRLLEAADAERRRLEARLRDGAVRRLASLEAQLAEARATASVRTAASIQQAQEQLVKTSSDLHELAAGLHPRELVEHGLGPAVSALAERSPIGVDIQVLAGRLPEQVEAVIYFICSEALTNVGKHAHASSASVRIGRIGRTVRIEIRDDGRGGAEPRSIADRVEALGGRLHVDSPAGGGTRLLAEIRL